jgi:hypothetical protein
MKMAVLWEVAPCSQVDTDRRFRGAYGESESASETSTNIYQITRCNIPEDSNLYYIQLQLVQYLSGFWMEFTKI